MGLFTRRRRGKGPAALPDPPSDVEARGRTVAHFREFVATRVGVEAYVEPATTDVPVTLVLIATTGEWTRRRVPDARSAWALGRELGVPVYDVQLTGYPARMRRWTSANRHRA